MSIVNLTISDLNSINKELEFTQEEKKNGNLWLARARSIRDKYGLTDTETLDIANRRYNKYLAY